MSLWEACNATERQRISIKAECPRNKCESVRAERQEQKGRYKAKGVECLKSECYNDYSEVKSADIKH